ncbi:hypothetical protein L3Q82_025601, partial [Scortum barcoo]
LFHDVSTLAREAPGQTVAVKGERYAGSYTVTTIKFGFKIDITSVNNGSYNINITEVGRPETAKTSSVQYPDSSHEILHLKPCTEYKHNVAFIDSTGKEIHCTHTENKTTTTGMSKDDVKDIRCTPGYVCYRSEWDISSSLSASNKIPAEPCRSDKKAFSASNLVLMTFAQN